MKSKLNVGKVSLSKTFIPSRLQGYSSAANPELWPLYGGGKHKEKFPMGITGNIGKGTITKPNITACMVFIQHGRSGSNSGIYCRTVWIMASFTKAFMKTIFCFKKWLVRFSQGTGLCCGLPFQPVWKLTSLDRPQISLYSNPWTTSNISAF